MVVLVSGTGAGAKHAKGRRVRAEALYDQPVPPELVFLSDQLIRIYPSKIFTWGIDDDHVAMTRRSVVQPEAAS